MESQRYLVEAPPPVLLNTWKHHAGALRQRIALAVDAGSAGLATLARELVVIGAELMDLYTGPLTAAEIAERVLERLKAEGHFAPEVYRAWVLAGGGYRVFTLAEDQSRWVLRLGEEDGRYVHVHPARWAPATLRVRANVLKTAVMVLAYVGVFGGEPLDVTLINRVRRQYLGFAPIKGLTGDQGIRGVIAVLR
jgi:cytosine/adenosine deaminase-related metal-dependent hydrolase